MFSVFFYYISYASIVLVYGIGMERAVYLSGNKNPLWLKAIKMLITASSVSALSYLFVNSLLVPAELSELYPFDFYSCFGFYRSNYQNNDKNQRS